MRDCARLWWGVAAVTAGLVAAGAAETGAAPGEGAFWKENDAAMVRMMKEMDGKPTGDVDKDFVDMMVPHHQGAIDMAEAVLKYGKNERVRRLAQEIIVTQQEEIAAMRMAVGEKLPASVAAPTGGGSTERGE